MLARVGRGLRALRELEPAFFVGPAAAGAQVLMLTRRVWGSRAAAGDDVMAHLVRARWGIDHLFLHGHIDGFMPSFATGYQEFLFFGQGFTALLAMTRVLSLGALSIAGALKVVTVLSLVLLPVAACFLARSFGLSRRAAGYASLLSLLVNNPFGVGPAAVFGPALVPQQIGAILACGCLGGAIRLVHESRRRWIALTAACAAAIVVTHVITVFIVVALLLVTLPQALLSGRPRVGLTFDLVLTSAIAGGLSAFWLFPFLAHRNLHGPVTTWSTPSLVSRLAAVMGGTYLFRPHVAMVVVGGMGFAIARATRGGRWATTLVLTPVGFVALSRIALHRYPANEIVIQLENRGIGLAAIIATFGLAAGVAWLTRRAGLIGDLVGLTGVTLLVGHVIAPWSFQAQQQPPPSSGLRAAAYEIRRELPSNGRFAEVRQFPQDVKAGGGVEHPDFYLAYISGRSTLNEFNVESTRAVRPAFVPEHLLDQPAGADADALARLGVTLVVSSNAEATLYLLQSAQFTRVWEQSGWSVLRVDGRPEQPYAGSLLSVNAGRAEATRRGDGGHLVIAARASVPTTAVVAVAWSPNWHVRINRRAVHFGRTSDGLGTLELPAGPSTVSLDWRSDPFTTLGVAVSLLTLGCAGMLMFRGPGCRRDGLLGTGTVDASVTDTEAVRPGSGSLPDPAVP